MDIVVTCPKSEIDHFWNDKFKCDTAWWDMARLPKNAKEGERIYFVINNLVVAKAVIEFIDRDSMLIEFRNMVKLKSPIAMKGFRGFRYWKK